jgi:hypothetical protein
VAPIWRNSAKVYVAGTDAAGDGLVGRSGLAGLVVLVVLDSGRAGDDSAPLQAAKVVAAAKKSQSQSQSPVNQVRDIAAS